MRTPILTVLLIDDSAEYTDLVQHWLSSTGADMGFDLNSRSTLAAGLGRLESGDVDIILLDLGLPDCRGFETYAKIRAGAHKTPIVVLGSSDLDSVALGMIREGASDYLVKSTCTAEMLIGAMHHANQVAETIVVQIPEELPRELVSEYLDDCGNSLIDLKAAVMNSDYEQARVRGHGLKGTGSPYGFPMLTQLGAAIERAAIRKETPELEKRVEQLAEYLGRLKLA